MCVCEAERETARVSLRGFLFAYCLVYLVIIISTICYRAYDKQEKEPCCQEDTDGERDHNGEMYRGGREEERGKIEESMSVLEHVCPPAFACVHVPSHRSMYEFMCVQYGGWVGVAGTNEIYLQQLPHLAVSSVFIRNREASRECEQTYIVMSQLTPQPSSRCLPQLEQNRV